MTGESSSGSAKRCAFITGATGFVGSHLTRRLVNEGWSVHILVRSTSDRKLLKDLEGRFQPHVHNGKTEQLCTIMADVKPDVVFHLASLFLAQHHTKDILPLFESNLVFPAQLLEAMAKNRVTRLINMGTSWQHFENRGYSPVNLYAATKQAFEDIIQYYVETANLKAVTLKLYDTYGPDDPRPKLLALLLNTARTGQHLLMSPGEQLIDLVHVTDVVNACLVASDYLYRRTNAGHNAFAVTTGKFVRLKDFVALFQKTARKKLNIQWGSRPYRPREVMKPWDEGQLLPGWQPSISLENGIAELICKIRTTEQRDF